MKAPALNKKKVFFVKEMTNNYQIDVSKLKQISRKQFEELLTKKNTKSTVKLNN
jgi:hypothetical protein